LIRKIHFGALGIVVGLAFLFSLLNSGASGRLNENLDYGRFWADLERISSETHYIRSPGHRRLQDWLEGRAREIGEGSPRFELQVDEFDFNYNVSDAQAKIYNNIFGVSFVPPLKNFIITVRGTNQSGKALMIVSHYDGIGGPGQRFIGYPGAIYPGTTDAGIHVAAILEVMRYAVINPVENDVIFLITDGEEDGLLGARRYMESLANPTEKIGLVANFESAGTSGTLVMFETGAHAAGTIRSFTKVAGTAYSNSLATRLYEIMPNSTDMTVFKKHGLAGLNFACAGHGQHYHTPDDNMENLNKALAQQTLNTVLSMYVYYGNYDFNKITGDEALVYFTFYHWGLIILPVWAVYILAGFMTACFAVVMVLKRKDFSREFFKKNTIRYLKTANATFHSMMAAITVTYLISLILNAATGVWLAPKFSTFGIVFSTMLIAMIIFTAAQYIFCRHFKVTKKDAFVFAALLQFSLTAVLAFVLPEASYLFLIPALINVTALTLENAVKNKTAVAIIKNLHLPVLSAAFAFTTVVTFSILAVYAFGTRIAPFTAVLPLFALCAFPTLLIGDRVRDSKTIDAGISMQEYRQIRR